MSIWHTCLFLIFLIPPIEPTKDCPFTPQTRLKSGEIADIVFEEDSKKCTDNLPDGPLKACSAGVAEVTFSPVLFILNGSNVLPYIDLNVNVNGTDFVSDIFIQLECLISPNKENKYCHDHSDPIQKWGKNYWPCRHHKILSPPTDVKLPIIYNHACFRMHGRSQYHVYITLMPQKCQLKYIVTLPIDYQLEPAIAIRQTTTNEEVSEYLANWSPMLIMDSNEKDYVAMNFSANPYDNNTDVTITVYQRFKDGTKLIHEEAVTPPQKSVKFNAAAGDYHAFAYVRHPNCRLICDSSKNQDPCTVCSHTPLNFTLAENHLSGAQSLWKLFTIIMTYLMYFILILLAFALITATGIYVYYQIIRPKRLARLPPQPIEMAARPKVLIIYSDDNSEHTCVVNAFAELLQHHANAQILIDFYNLIDPSITPSLWLIQAISEANFVIIIFSEASSKIMSGETLISRRPFPEMFNSAVRMIISKINDILTQEGIQLQNNNHQISQALSKFIISRFSYTTQDAIPEYFSLLPCRRIVIPKDLGLLFGYLHSVNVTQRNTLEFDADLAPLNQAIISYQNFVATNPNWLPSRFQSNHLSETQGPQPKDVSERLPLKKSNETEAAEMKAMAEKYKLALPHDSDDDDNDHDHQHQPNRQNGDVEKYKLIGDLDDISSVSSDD